MVALATLNTLRYEVVTQWGEAEGRGRRRQASSSGKARGADGGQASSSAERTAGIGLTRVAGPASRQPPGPNATDNYQ